jgi:hypothetical protein
MIFLEADSVWAAVEAKAQIKEYCPGKSKVSVTIHSLNLNSI